MSPLFAPGARPSPLTLRPATQSGPLGDTTLNPTTVSATQSGHNASATMELRFVAAITATQSPAIAAVQMAERFLASIVAQHPAHQAALQGREDFVETVTATQAAATAAIAITERFVAIAAAVQSPAVMAAQLTEISDATLAVSAVQSPHTIAASLANPDAAQQSGGGAGRRSRRAAGAAFALGGTVGRRQPVPVPARVVARVVAVQQPHSATGVLEHRAAVDLRARQRPAEMNATARVDNAHLNDEEIALLTYFLMAA